MSVKIDVRPGPMTAEHAIHRFRFFRRRLARMYGLALSDPAVDGLVLGNLWNLPQPMRDAIHRELYRRRQWLEQKRRPAA